MPNRLLEVKGFESQFMTSDGIVHSVNDISFDLKERKRPDVVLKADLVGELPCSPFLI